MSLSTLTTLALVAINICSAKRPPRHKHDDAINETTPLALLTDSISDDTGWNTLVSTFGGFYSIPITLYSVESKGWTSVLSCSDSDVANGSPGLLYSEGDDLSTMPFYNADGYIAGIVIGMVDPGTTSEAAPFKKYSFPNGTVFWGIEAHFRDPTTTCTSTSDDTSNGTIGNRLWFANGNDGTYFSVPLTEDKTQLDDAGWENGKCFVGMGQHYWRYISADEECNDLYPMFLLYTRGKLNAWGAALGHDDSPYLTSYRWEHPQGDEIKFFFQDDTLPQCLLETDKQISTQHIYMTNWVWNNCI